MPTVLSPDSMNGKVKIFFHSCGLGHAGTFNESIDAETGFEPGAESRHPDALYSNVRTLPLHQTRIWWIFFRHKTFAQKKCSLDLLISTIMNNFLLVVHLTSSCEILHPPLNYQKT